MDFDLIFKRIVCQEEPQVFLKTKPVYDTIIKCGLFLLPIVSSRVIYDRI